MSQHQTDDQQEQQQPDLRELREAAERGRAAEARAVAAERRAALLEAGVPTGSPIGAMFLETYKGDLTTEAITTAWEAIGVPGAPAEPAPPSTPAPSPEQLDETQSRRLLTTGGAGDMPHEVPPADPVARGYEGMQERLRNGEDRAAAAGDVFGSLIQAANEGDPRAVWTGWTKEQLDR